MEYNQWSSRFRNYHTNGTVVSRSSDCRTGRRTEVNHCDSRLDDIEQRSNISTNMPTKLISLPFRGT